MENEFSGKVVLVTGAAGGIGGSLLKAFGSLGAKVCSTDIVPLGIERFTQGDISDPDFTAEWISSVIRAEGRIDILLNNAGICPRTGLMDVSVEEWKRVLDVNLTSVFVLSQLCMKQMISQKSGAIVNLASLAGKVGGIAVGAHYSASKAAIACLTKTLARHGAPYGVRVNAVAPGIVDTDITKSAKPEQIASFNETIPLGRIASPDEIAGPILFLASSAASYITGATLDVNGGLLMD